MPFLLLLQNKYVRYILIILVLIVSISSGIFFFIKHIEHKEDIKIKHEQLILQEHILNDEYKKDSILINDYNLDKIDIDTNTKDELKLMKPKLETPWSKEVIPVDIREQLNADFK